MCMGKSREKQQGNLETREKGWNAYLFLITCREERCSKREGRFTTETFDIKKFENVTRIWWIWHNFVWFKSFVQKPKAQSMKNFQDTWHWQNLGECKVETKRAFADKGFLFFFHMMSNVLKSVAMKTHPCPGSQGSSPEKPHAVPDCKFGIVYIYISALPDPCFYLWVLMWWDMHNCKYPKKTYVSKNVNTDVQGL